MLEVPGGQVVAGIEGGQLATRGALMVTRRRARAGRATTVVRGRRAGVARSVGHWSAPTIRSVSHVMIPT